MIATPLLEPTETADELLRATWSATSTRSGSAANAHVTATADANKVSR
jgi:hypothetical protein